MSRTKPSTKPKAYTLVLSFPEQTTLTMCAHLLWQELETVIRETTAVSISEQELRAAYVSQ